SMREAKTVVNRFLSIMTWCDDQFAVAQDGWAGNRVPCPVARRNLTFTMTHNWIFDRKIPTDRNALRALALYREARNAEQNYLVSYAVLNYYKIIEVGHPKESQTRAWLATAFPLIEPEIRVEVLQIFHSERGTDSPDKHIYDAYRLAVAHASSKTISDPDCAAEISRLHVAAEVLRELARHFISTELKVSDCIYSGD
ncbi:MAG: methylamine utilization protein MauJ, partial [Alphaproteobacteria bacterium]